MTLEVGGGRSAAGARLASTPDQLLPLHYLHLLSLPLLLELPLPLFYFPHLLPDLWPCSLLSFLQLLLQQ